MSSRIRTRIAFIGRSMTWALLLYAVMMLLINWEEVSNVVNNKAGITVVEQPAATPGTNPSGTPPVNITTRAHTLITVVRMIQAIAGIPVNQ